MKQVLTAVYRQFLEGAHTLQGSKVSASSSITSTAVLKARQLLVNIKTDRYIRTDCSVNGYEAL